MQSILQQLYHGDLCPQADIKNSSAIAQYREICSEILMVQAPELQPKFKLLTDDLSLACALEAEHVFYQGFSLAVKLLTETLAL